MECFVINHINGAYNDACNRERDQMRKHSVHEPEWYEIFDAQWWEFD